MELAQAQYERRAPTLASQRDSVTHDLRHTVPSHVLETQPAAPVCVTPRTPGRIAESNGPAFRGPARGPSDGLENSDELMVSEMCAGARAQHWGDLAVFRNSGRAGRGRRRSAATFPFYAGTPGPRPATAPAAPLSRVVEERAYPLFKTPRPRTILHTLAKNIGLTRAVPVPTPVSHVVRNVPAFVNPGRTDRTIRNVPLSGVTGEPVPGAKINERKFAPFS